MRRFEQARCWTVHVSLPSANGRSWRENKKITVIAADGPIRAAKMVEEAFPGASIWNIKHDGIAALLLDDEAT